MCYVLTTDHRADILREKNTTIFFLGDNSPHTLPPALLGGSQDISRRQRDTETLGCLDVVTEVCPSEMCLDPSPQGGV